MPEPVPATHSPSVQSPFGSFPSRGECLNLAALTQRGAAWRVQAYPAGFALLLHPSGPVLLDTGYGPQVPRLMRRWPGVLYGLITRFGWRREVRRRRNWPGCGWMSEHQNSDRVAPARRSCGRPAGVSGGAVRPGRRGLPPLRGLKGLRAVRRAFRPSCCRPIRGPHGRAVFAPAPAWLAPFAEAADIFADESVWAVRVPGHAPGMIALIVREAAAGEDGSEWTLLATHAAWNSCAAPA